MLHAERHRAESFGAVAELYDRSRPSYPPALVDALLEQPVSRALDVGCGTGIAAALLAQRGVEVLGVEVDARMAALARSRGLTVEVARFEDWDDAGRRFELVTSAQAWHWVDPVAGAAKAASVLAPGGRLCVFWNLADPPAEFLERVNPVYERLAPGVERYSVLLGRGRRERARPALEAIAANGDFADAQARTFPWSRSYDTQAWLAQLMTHSDHQTLPVRQREALLEAVGAELDALGGSFEMRYEAVLGSARRL